MVLLLSKQAPGRRDGTSCHTADSCRDRHPSQAAAAVWARRSSSFCIINVALTMPEEGGREGSGSELYDWVMVIVAQQQHSFPERTCFSTVIMRGVSR